MINAGIWREIANTGCRSVSQILGGTGSDRPRLERVQLEGMQRIRTIVPDTSATLGCLTRYCSKGLGETLKSPFLRGGSLDGPKLPMDPVIRFLGDPWVFLKEDGTKYNHIKNKGAPSNSSSHNENLRPCFVSRCSFSTRRAPSIMLTVPSS